MDLTRDQQLAMHRSMVRIRLFEEAAGRLTERARCPASSTSTSARRPSPSACARPPRRRPHHLDPPRPRPPRRQGRRLLADDGRADGQGHRLLRRQGRVDAHQRPRRSACSAPTASSAPACRSRSAPGSATSTSAPTRSSVAFFGDASTNIGAFHEAANMACALHLPVVFVCEHNEYGEYTPTRQGDGDHRHRRPRRGLRHARRDRRRHGRPRRPRGDRRSGRPRPRAATARR